MDEVIATKIGLGSTYCSYGMFTDAVEQSLESLRCSKVMVRKVECLFKIC